MFPARFLFFLTFCWSVLCFSFVSAQTLTLLQERTGVGDQKTLFFGFKVGMPEGGILYAPTPAGTPSSFSPPQLEIENQENVSDTEMLFPPGKGIEKEGIKAWIFEDGVVLPCAVTLEHAHKAAFVEGALEGIFCWKNRCHPVLLPFQVFWTGEKGEEGNGSQLLQQELRKSEESPSILDDFLVSLKEESRGEESIESLSFFVALGSAFLGGLILNLMPCVLPVLALKIMNVLKGPHESSVKSSFWANFLGIQTFFFLFGSLSVLLRFWGQTLFWGAHFQNPWVLAILMGIMILFGANLMGWWAVLLPSRVSTWIQRLGTKGDFFKGFIAALLATPCSAPFLGVALGSTLLLSATQGFLVLMSVGVGLGFPSLVLALFPSLASIVPSPGPWMIKLKRILALGLFLAAAWLGSILWGSLVPQYDSEWEQFSEERLIAAQQEGKKVLINITASWCLTCQLNAFRVWKNMSPESDEVWLEGDWRRSDPALEAFMKRFGRNGIPFTIIFSPTNPKGKVLPELLNLSDVETALDRSLKSVR